MSKIFTTGLFLLFGYLCLFQSNWIGAEEKLFIGLDEKDWQINYQAMTEDPQLIHRTLGLESEDGVEGQEKIDVLIFPSLDVPAENMANALIKSTKDELVKKLKKDIQVTIIEPKKLNILEHSQEITDINPYEYSLGRVLEGKGSSTEKKAIYLVIYSTTDKNIYKQNKDKWLKSLKEAYIAEEPKNEDGTGLNLSSFSTEQVFKGDRELKYE